MLSIAKTESREQNPASKGRSQLKLIHAEQGRSRKAANRAGTASSPGFFFPQERFGDEAVPLLLEFTLRAEKIQRILKLSPEHRHSCPRSDPVARENSFQGATKA